MRVRVVVDLEVGGSPVRDAISYFVARNGLAVADDRRRVPEWVEAVIVDSIERAVDDIVTLDGDRWEIRSTSVRNTY